MADCGPPDKLRYAFIPAGTLYAAAAAGPATGATVTDSTGTRGEAAAGAETGGEAAGGALGGALGATGCGAGTCSVAKLSETQLQRANCRDSVTLSVMPAYPNCASSHYCQARFTFALVAPEIKAASAATLLTISGQTQRLSFACSSKHSASQGIVLPASAGATHHT